MGDASAAEDDGTERSVDLSKGAADPPAGSPAGSSAEDEPFDPYRFGRPEHPVPPEFAPPGYVPDPPVSATPTVGLPQWPGAPGPGQAAPPNQPYEPYVSPYPWNAPYGPSPYGPPPPHAQPAGNGKALTALILGIGSIVMFWTSILDAVLGITAVVFGIIALNEHRARANRPGAHGSTSARKGMAVAGLVCAGVGIVLAIVWTVVIVRATNQCGGLERQNSSGFQQCVQDQIFN